MQFIEVTIDSISTENNHKKKLDINDIMKKLETFNFLINWIYINHLKLNILTIGIVK